MYPATTTWGPRVAARAVSGNQTALAMVCDLTYGEARVGGIENRVVPTDAAMVAASIVRVSAKFIISPQ